MFVVGICVVDFTALACVWFCCSFLSFLFLFFSFLFPWLRFEYRNEGNNSVYVSLR